MGTDTAPERQREFVLGLQPNRWVACDEIRVRRTMSLISSLEHETWGGREVFDERVLTGLPQTIA